MVYQYVLEHYYEHTFMILYTVNLVLAIIAYKLGFAKKLPLLKSLFVYIILIVGMFVMNILFIVVPTAWGSNPLPFTESIVVINIVLGIYRLRLHFERKKNTNE